jgi:hypothetical protein
MNKSTLSTLAMLLVMLGGVVAAVFHIDAARMVAGAALLVYFAIEGRAAVGRGKITLLVSALAAAAALAMLPDPGRVLLLALGEAAFITGLFVALGMLRDAAEGSATVQASGELMVRQPPGRRYLVLCLGSHVISLVLNFGVLTLLGTMVNKGNTLAAAGGDARITAIRNQRMMTAILRGFVLMTVWSPLSVSFAVVQSVVHGLPWRTLLPLQIGLTALLLGLGWVLDRRAFPPVANLPGVGGPMDWTPLVRLCLLVAAVVAASVTVGEALNVRLVVGAMLVVPLSGLVWLAVQRRSAVAGARHLAQRLTVGMPAFRNEAAILGGAMFFGTVLTAFVSPAATAQAIATLHLPPAVVAVLLAWAVMALAQVGVSQIISVTILGGALADLSVLGINPLVLASGLMGAWALSACSTPVGAAIMTVARLSEVPVTVVARRWNGPFVLTGAVLLAGWMLGLSAVLG